MQKVMIVDDELIFRDYLRTVLDWETLGFSISQEARHGLEALELAAAEQPDIALVDITMPFMDGLQLAEKLREDYPDVSIVLITGHNEFEYARKALKLGVEDYILKPFSKDELLLTLVKLRQRHQKAQEEKLTLRENTELMKESFLSQLISREYALSEPDTMKRLQQLGIQAEPGYYVAACIEIDQMDRKWSKASDRLLMKYAVTNVLNEAMEESRDYLIFNGPEGRIIALARHPEEQENELPQLESYKKLCFLIKKYLNFTITVGVGRSKHGFKGIAASYGEALEALQNKFVLGNDRVIAYGEQLPSGGNQPFYPTEANDELLVLLRLNVWEPIERKLDDIFQTIRERRLPIDYIYVICMGLVSVNLSYFEESGHPVEDCFGDHFFPYNEIRKLDTAELTFDWLKELFRKSVIYNGKHRNTRSSKIAKSAKAYMEQHYADPGLQLEQIAAHVFINASYLRAVFKKEIGITVSDYLTQYRMQKAKELLARNSARLTDIAEKVGYNDPGYFSKSFKKFYGYSPSEYEKSRS
ncbi:response regulator [Paenibacillus sp. YIM B09110]|uniref:response regulator n=1 Tax=Paenibacillus sp. YIM B09110 TaxID=3126102 RepID=UPI00301DA8E3